MLTGAPLYEEIDRINLAYEINLLDDLDSVEKMLTVPESDLALFFEAVPGRRMLDAGCGWGRYVSRFVDAGMQYVGVDYSPEMVALSREANPGQDFHVLSYHALAQEFQENTFDSIWACCVFGGQPKARTHDALRQLHNVLKPGGVALFIIPLSLESYEAVQETPYGPMYYSAWDMEEFGTCLQEAGFTLTDMEVRYECGSVTFLTKK